MNALRLVSKRLMRVVESCATRLTQLDYNGPESFPLALRRCKRIEHIRCESRNLESLEGCPDGLKSLDIGYGSHILSLDSFRGCTELKSLEIWQACQISDLTPLNVCSRLKTLIVRGSKVSVLSSMPLLEEIALTKAPDHPSIKDLSPLAHCTQLQMLDMWDLTKITDLKPLSSLTKLQCLYMISGAPVEDLTPLSVLQDLEELHWSTGASLTLPPPPSSLWQDASSARDFDLLKERRPDIYTHCI